MLKIDGVPYWRLSGFYFLFFLTIGSFMPYWSLYLKSIGMTAHNIGILSAIVVVTKIFSSLLWGWLVDHTGKQVQIIRWASLFSFLSFALVLLAQTFWPLLIILFVFSIFWSAALPLIETVTLSHLGEKSDCYTTIRIWGSISFIFIVLLLGQVFDHQPINYLVPIILVTLLLVWIHSLFLSEVSTASNCDNDVSFMTILLKPNVITLMIVCFIVQAGHGPYYTFFSIYLEEHNYSNSFIGMAWAMGVLAEVLIYIFMHKIIVRFRLNKLMLWVLILATMRWLLIALFVDNVFLLLLSQALHAATFGVYHAVAIQYVHREFKGQHQGRGQALYSSLSFGAGLALGSLISGFLWDYAGGIQTFMFAAMLSAVGVLITKIYLKS